MNKNNKGQMTVEAVLIMTVLLGIFIFVSSSIRDNALLAQLVHGPWDRLSAMTKYGVWQPETAAVNQHPNLRVISVRGEDPQ